MKKASRWHLVGSDPANVFEDLDALRTKFDTPLRRDRSRATFARIPHDKGLELGRAKIGRNAWTLLIEIDRLVIKGGGRNPVRLWSSRLKKIGVTKHARAHALRQLEATGVVKVDQRGVGLSPLVTYLWYPEHD